MDLVARISIAAARIREMPGVFEDVRQSMSRRCRACIHANVPKYPIFPAGCNQNVLADWMPGVKTRLYKMSIESLLENSSSRRRTSLDYAKVVSLTGNKMKTYTNPMKFDKFYFPFLKSYEIGNMEGNIKPT
ncbi:hypothetical protein TNCV_4470971 [Trichonephila clavipes]|uniref:Uncharacterized protein n=1 Tax=Trichonephila clavipes TaxID=2585209 RepID=A0A8X6SDD0_TRICX|nr:hypothetical protein TNCV_4470971 [Trichonephila clavipes]